MSDQDFPIDLSKVKLVVSDLDGALLNTNNEVSPRFFKQFEKLKQRNIHFVATSGRQFQSIIDKLYSIKDCISIIGENGGIIQHNNRVKVLLELTRTDVTRCVDVLRTIPECFIVLCGIKAAYIESSHNKFLSHLKNYYSVIKSVEDLNELYDDKFLKIAVYHFNSSEELVFPYLDFLKDRYQVIVSGQHWLDISHIKANKSYALKIIQEQRGISKEETLVFGDYNNDLEMLELAQFSYAMANAHPNVRDIASYITKSNSEEGVEHIIDKLLQE
ncbi:HAD family hydrolase [Winogradskyella forsetii]|uniref:HAD family hydrolase n=1 Tax=Winogradskyella forsetii TaxID=2686077 RepID=UPI001C544E20|nr:HAD family hydrolase [Winogradskyella forsetii]